MNKTDLTQYKDRGYTGLANLGNTCFLNACLQVLHHTYELNAILDSPQIKKHVKESLSDTKIINEWNNLREVMWQNNGVVSPNRFVHHVQLVAREKNCDLFTGFAQNDMSEFLQFIIQCLHNSVSRPMTMRISGNVENHTDKMATECYKMLRTVYSKEYSEIMDLYYAIYVSEISALPKAPGVVPKAPGVSQKVVPKGSKTKTSAKPVKSVIYSIKPECYFMVELPLPSPTQQDPMARMFSIQSGPTQTFSIYDCFDEFTKYEVLEGDNAWYNEAKGCKEDVRKRFTFWNFPKILVVSLKRFSPCGEYKRHDLVDFPMTDLDLTRYVSGYNAQQYKYELFGVCNHIGGVQGGHYTAFVKNADLKWLEYNDTHVTEIREDQVVSQSAYCLFYRYWGV